MYYVFIVHSSAEGHLAIAGSAAMSIAAQMSLHTNFNFKQFTF